MCGAVENYGNPCVRLPRVRRAGGTPPMKQHAPAPAVGGDEG